MAARLEHHRINAARVIGDQERRASLGQWCWSPRFQVVPEVAIEHIDPPEQPEGPVDLRLRAAGRHQAPGHDQDQRREREQDPETHRSSRYNGRRRGRREGRSLTSISHGARVVKPCVGLSGARPKAAAAPVSWGDRRLRCEPGEASRAFRRPRGPSTTAAHGRRRPSRPAPRTSGSPARGPAAAPAVPGHRRGSAHPWSRWPRSGHIGDQECR